MATRWMQAKKTKMRRAYLKRPKSAGINKGIYKDLYFEAAKSIGKDTGHLDHRYPGCINQRPTDPWLKTRESEKRFEDDNTMWQSAWWQGWSRWYTVTLLDARMQMVQLVFSGNRFAIIKWDWVRKQVSRSITYRSHDRAMAAYGHSCDHVAWIEIQPTISQLTRS